MCSSDLGGVLDDLLLGDGYDAVQPVTALQPGTVLAQRRDAHTHLGQHLVVGPPGALLDELMIARNLQLTGGQWQAGWILSASILTKIWIDVFIGVWAFLLAILWIRKVENRGSAVSVSPMEIWFRFPKFVLAYFIAWLSYLAIAAAWPALKPLLASGTGVVQGPMRTLLFMLTFVAMGAMTDFSKLKGMTRVAVLYGLALVVVIVPIAYVVAYLFHRGLAPPLVP